MYVTGNCGNQAFPELPELPALAIGENPCISGNA